MPNQKLVKCRRLSSVGYEMEEMNWHAWEGKVIHWKLCKRIMPGYIGMCTNQKKT